MTHDAYQTAPLDLGMVLLVAVLATASRLAEWGWAVWF